MASELFGEDFADLIYDAMGGELLPGTLYRKSGVAADPWGTAVPTYVETPVEGILTVWDTNSRVTLGYTVQTMKIMLLANNEGGPIPVPADGDQVMLDGRRFTAKDVTFGAGQATYDMAGIPV